MEALRITTLDGRVVRKILSVSDNMCVLVLEDGDKIYFSRIIQVKINDTLHYIVCSEGGVFIPDLTVEYLIKTYIQAVKGGNNG